MGTDAAQRRQRKFVRAGHAANAVMGGTDAVQRNADAAQPGGGGARDALVCQIAPAGLQVASHPGGADCGDDLKPVLAQIGFAADQADVARAKLGNLLDQVERLGGGELVPAAAARARPAMLAREVAGKRDLPDHAHRHAVHDIVESRVADGQSLGPLLRHRDYACAFFAATSSLAISLSRSPKYALTSFAPCRSAWISACSPRWRASSTATR